jgi:hypothetical protein
LKIPSGQRHELIPFLGCVSLVTFPPILDRLQITADQWRINATQFENVHPKRFNRPTPQLDTG